MPLRPSRRMRRPMRSRKRRSRRSRLRRTRPDIPRMSLPAHIKDVVSGIKPSVYTNNYTYGFKGVVNKAMFINLAEVFDAGDITILHNLAYPAGGTSTKSAMPFVAQISGSYQLKSESVNTQVVDVYTFMPRYDLSNAFIGTVGLGGETWTNILPILGVLLNRENNSLSTTQASVPYNFDPMHLSLVFTYFKMQKKRYRLLPGKVLNFKIRSRHRWVNGNRFFGPNSSSGQTICAAKLHVMKFAIVRGTVEVIANIGVTAADFSVPACGISGIESYSYWAMPNVQLPTYTTNENTSTVNAPSTINEVSGLQQTVVTA